ncbi:RNA recognition motif domain-containing protein [Candidatus Neptunochlamydia vexilliferae]|uniref:RNA-binding protein RbpE n=1 Tax=Candidatus Neptunichlamydia vexilliferae TaxID=1651774 RepID=A0ABS0B262_9BACT|nr:RNA-binding protein [Candidatus Neptunochlamydia vexilliferae]MBF5059811.1 putative RNA-binding protein RbpE [Candidatus Neptunochlamydia vexilliferae]
MKLFVANISRECSEDELNEVFSNCGEVKSLKIIKDRDTGQSRGFGFVEMETREAGDKAIQELHDKEVHGRALVVNEAKEQQKRPAGGGGRRGGPGRY